MFAHVRRHAPGVELVRQANHAPDENLDLDRFHTGIKTAAAVLAHLGAAGQHGASA